MTEQVVQTPLITKYLGRLILFQIAVALPNDDFDPHQFAYETERTTEDALNTALAHAMLICEGDVCGF